MRTAAGVQHGSSATGAVRVNEIGYRRIEADKPQGLNNEIALPRSVAITIPMLHGAAPTHAKVRADRGDALRARGSDVQKAAPVWMASDLLDIHGFARQRARDVNRAGGAGSNAVSPVAETIDEQALNHAAPR